MGLFVMKNLNFSPMPENLHPCYCIYHKNFSFHIMTYDDDMSNYYLFICHLFAFKNSVIANKNTMLTYVVHV